MSFNKIQEKKSNDIISDSDIDSDNESVVLSPDVKKTLIEKIPLTHNKIKIMNKKNDSINDSINDSEHNELCELLKTNCVVSEGKRETAKKDEEIRLKLICDYVNNNTSIGVKIKEHYKKKFNKEIKKMEVYAKLKDHFDILITHTDGSKKKCEEKGTKTFYSNLNEIKKPWQYSVQIFNGIGNHYKIGRMFSRIWYDNNIYPGKVKEEYNIESPIPSYEEWSKDAFRCGEPKTDYVIELKKKFRETHGPKTSMNSYLSVNGFIPNNFDYRKSVIKELKNLYTDKIKKIFIKEVQEKFNTFYKHKECYLQTTGNIQTENFTFKWFDKIEIPKVTDIIMKDNSLDVEFDIIKESKDNINYSLILRFGKGAGFTNIRIDTK